MTFVRRFTFGVALLIFVPLLQCQSNVKTVDLTFTTIDVPGYAFNAVAGINSAGDMVGYYGAADTALNLHGFVLRDGALTSFDYPDAESTVAWGINDSGLIVGDAYFSGGLIVHGFLYDGQTFTRFDAPNEPQTYPGGINNAGRVVGGAGDAGVTITAFQTKDNQFKGLNIPGRYTIKSARGINNLGQIVGYVSLGPCCTSDRGFLYKDGNLKPLAFPGAFETVASGINDNGVVVGWYFVLGSSNCYGFAYKDGTYHSFEIPGATCVGGYKINNSGQIVGMYELPDYSWHGFVSSPITAADLK